MGEFSLPAERVEQGDEGEEECKPIRLEKKKSKGVDFSLAEFDESVGNAEALMTLLV